MEHGPDHRTRFLWAPAAFWFELDGDLHKRITGCNGCGTSQSLWIPDTMWCLRVTICCNIHDWMCKLATSREDRRWVDKVFFQNLCAWIRQESGWFMRHPRLLRALIYFRGVQIGSWAIAKGSKL